MTSRTAVEYSQNAKTESWGEKQSLKFLAVWYGAMIHLLAGFAAYRINELFGAHPVMAATVGLVVTVFSFIMFYRRCTWRHR